jgi:hypothetical protein
VVIDQKPYFFLRGQTMRKNKIQILIMIFMMVFTTGLIQPSLSEAAISSISYDFGEVLVSSTIMLALSLTNPEDTSTTITGLELAQTDCSDFSVVATPEIMTIPPNGTIHVYIGFTPSSIGNCSDTLRVYADNPLPYLVTLTGTGIGDESAQPDPSNISRPYLTQNDEIAKLNAERDRKLSKIEEKYQHEFDKAYEKYLRDASEKKDKDKAESKFQKRKDGLQKKYNKKQKDIQKWYDEKLAKIELRNQNL